MYRMAPYLQPFSVVHISDARDGRVECSSDHHSYLQKFQWLPSGNGIKYMEINREGNKINKDEDNPTINYKYIKKGPILVKMGNIHTPKRNFLVSEKTLKFTSSEKPSSNQNSSLPSAPPMTISQYFSLPVLHSR